MASGEGERRGGRDEATGSWGAGGGCARGSRIGSGEYVTPGLASKGLTFRNCRRPAGGRIVREGEAPFRVYSPSSPGLCES